MIVLCTTLPRPDKGGRVRGGEGGCSLYGPGQFGHKENFEKHGFSMHCEKLQTHMAQLSPVPALQPSRDSSEGTDIDPVAQSTLPSVPVDTGNSTVANLKAKIQKDE